MIKNIKYVYTLILLIVSFPQFVMSQSCGFGCLGLSGVYAGYSIENYLADGLNIQLNNQLKDMGINDQQYNFNSGQGFRFGMNIVRANFDTYFFSVKGYYQFLKEEQSVTALFIRGGDEYEFKSKLEMNHWALGVDFGIPLVDFMDWKIVDGSIKFYNTKLTNQVITNDKVIEENKFTMPMVTVGFTVGSGLIIHIVKDYVSIEGTGLYNFTQIEYLNNENDSAHIPEEGSGINLINRGGFSGIVQLNIGIPF